VLAVSVLASSPARAGVCVVASVSVYEAAGFSCNVGPVTFSDINVLTTTSGSGVVALGDFAPITLAGGEYGLALAYTSATGSISGSTADVGWTYNVSGVPALSDAYAAFTGTTTGTGSSTLAETLSNGVSLALTAAGATTAKFAPVSELTVIKDQEDFAGLEGSADSSLLVNAFSTPTAVPEPSSWAMMLLGFASLGYAGFRRSRKARLSRA